MSASLKAKAVPSTYSVRDRALDVMSGSRMRSSLPSARSRSTRIEKSALPTWKPSSERTEELSQSAPGVPCRQPRRPEPRSCTVRVADQISTCAVAAAVVAKAVLEGLEMPAELIAETR